MIQKSKRTAAIAIAILHQHLEFRDSLLCLLVGLEIKVSLRCEKEAKSLSSYH